MDLDVRNGARRNIDARKALRPGTAAAVLRKIPPPVVPMNISRGLAGEISMAEIGVPSNEPDIALQLCPLLSVRQSRFDPAHTGLTPLWVEGSMAITVNTRWSASSSEIWRGLISFQPEKFHGLPGR
jgi:hypothetical protein